MFTKHIALTMCSLRSFSPSEIRNLLEFPPYLDDWVPALAHRWPKRAYTGSPLPRTSPGPHRVLPGYGGQLLHRDDLVHGLSRQSPRHVGTTAPLPRTSPGCCKASPGC